MAVTRWSGEALAEMRSVENGLPAAASGKIRQMARQNAASAGREQVERGDVCKAVGEYFGADEDDEEERP